MDFVWINYSLMHKNDKFVKNVHFNLLQVLLQMYILKLF